MGNGTRLVADEVLDGRYRIGDVAGEGAMGTVYFAEHTLIGRKVAIKVLRADLAKDPDVVKRFMNEARAAGTLGHTNICESTDMGFVDGVPYLVLERLEGVVLADEIFARGSLAIRRVLRIGEQIADALAAAHAAGIVHRDLKSDNIFLTDREDRPDHVKVLDFGISELVDAASKRVQGLPAGTPEFTAPEQITSPGNVDERADIYALGVILYHMLSGRRPFSAPTLEALVAQVLHDPPPPLDRLRNEPALGALVDRMLAKRVADRPQSMREVADELARQSATLQTGVVARLREPTVPPPRLASSGEPATTAVTQVPARKRRGVWAAAGVVVALGASASVWQLGGSKPDDGAPAVATSERGLGAASPPGPAAPIAPPPAASAAAERAAPAAVFEAASPAPTEPGVVIDAGAASAETAPARSPRPPSRRGAAGSRTATSAIDDRPAASSESQPDAHVAEPARAAGGTAGSAAGGTAGSAAGGTAGSAAGGTAGSAAGGTAGSAAAPAPQAPSIDQAAVRAAVRRQVGEVQTCYERGRMDNLDLAGRIVLRIVIDTAGRAAAVSVESSTLAAPKVEGCIAAAVRGWQFPAARGGSVTISYPFALK